MVTSENSAHTNEYTVQVSAVTLGAQLLAIGCPSNERIPQLALVLGARHEHNETYATGMCGVRARALLYVYRRA
jgi:hypothetical protein